MDHQERKKKKSKSKSRHSEMEETPVKKDSKHVEDEYHESVEKKKKKKKKEKVSSMSDSVFESTDDQQSPQKRHSTSQEESPKKKRRKEKNGEATDAESASKSVASPKKPKVNSTTEPPGSDWSKADKMELFNKMLTMKACDSKDSYRVTLRKKWDWDAVAFGNKSPEECKEVFEETVKHLVKLKTVKQIIEASIDSLSKKSHIKGIFQRFIEDRRKQCIENGEKQGNLMDLRDEYMKISDEERAYYQRQIDAEKAQRPRPPPLPRSAFEIYFETKNHSEVKNKEIKNDFKEKYETLKEKVKCKYVEEAFKEYAKYEVEVKKYQEEHPGYKMKTRNTNADECDLYLRRCCGMPKKPSSIPRIAYYHKLNESGELNSLPGKARLLEAQKRFHALPEQEANAFKENVQQNYEEFLIKFEDWKSRQTEDVIALVDKYIKIPVKKPKVEKPARAKTTKILFENTITTNMSAPKFSNEPKLPPATGYKLYCQKYDHKVKNKFASAKEKTAAIQEQWGKTSDEHKAQYEQRCRSMIENSAKEVLEYCKGLEKHERKMYLGYNRAAIAKFFKKDIFEEDFPHAKYPVFIVSPKKNKKETPAKDVAIKKLDVDENKWQSRGNEITEEEEVTIVKEEIPDNYDEDDDSEKQESSSSSSSDSEEDENETENEEKTNASSHATKLELEESDSDSSDDEQEISKAWHTPSRAERRSESTSSSSDDSD